MVVKSRGEGDSHFAVFDCTTAALLAAVDLQRARAEVIGPRVRIALHTGEAEPRDGDYLGLLVNRTARLRSTAHAGQIVLSRVVAELVEDVEGVVVRSLGLHRVRDFGRPLELFQACADGIPTAFPPPVTLDTANTSVMTVVFVDQLDSTERARREPHILADWQRPLFRTLRVTADAFDGRFLKLIGDGCLVAFEDPRAALGFTHDLLGQPEFCFRIAVSAGLVEVVEGELSGLPLFEAASKLKHTRAGECWVAPVVAELIGGAHIGAPNGQAASELLAAPKHHRDTSSLVM